MKGRILGSLFALPFFSIGVWMLWSIGNTFFEASQMASWVQVEARLTAAGYETHTGDDSDTYQAYARYTYTYQGQSYVGHRVSITGSADNIGDYQQNTGRRLSDSLARGESITVFIDPDEPSNAIIDRSIRWGLVGFKSIFLFVFGGVGLGLLIVIWRAPKEKDKNDPQFAGKPWLLNDDWQSATIRSNSRTTMYAMWAFAAFWNLISAPLPFIVYDEVVNKNNYIALVALLFTAVGIGLLAWAIRHTLEWRRFGATPVTLDPFPGSIGGHVGGTIEIGIPFDAAIEFQVSLTHIHSYRSGSGKNRSQKEKAEWQDALIAHSEPGTRGTKLTFRFDVPAGQDESDTDKDDSYHLWRLNLSAELDGTDIDRSFEIPVYATATTSQQLSNLAVDRSREKQQAASDEAIMKTIRLEHDAGGRRMVYPIGRYLGSSLGVIVVGGAFAAVGWWLIVNEGQKIFGSVFGGIGVLIGIVALYTMSNSLEVARDSNGIRTVRRVLGIPVRRSYMRRDAFVKFTQKSSFQSQSGGKHVMYYSIYANDSEGDKIVVGEGFRGESEAKAAIRLIGRELGLSGVDSRDNDESSADSWDPAGLISG
ncbi:MAG: DUF3592 domain-containing protein [Gammaproteobacteria bacterium]|nr:DUF3592 domain-containing protein [Gammaproteobacteria bacterium]MDH3432004.1 DUF3592 domain-containing protein [Gammaproteobacteria bacterium]MDH3433481.1 DUF3592 domain-containing protein [Gammaproteobacteria bacterium]